MGRAPDVEIMISPWSGSSYYAPFAYVPKPRAQTINAHTPLMHEQRQAKAEHSQPQARHTSSLDAMDVLLTRLSFDVTPCSSDVAQSSHVASIESQLRRQVDYAMQRYAAADKNDARSLVRAALKTAVKHSIATASLIDTGGASPLYVALLHHDVGLAREMTQAMTCTPCSDLPLLLVCVASRDLELLKWMLCDKLPPATTHADQSDTDAVIDVVAALFDTQDAAFIADALELLLQQEHGFPTQVIQTWCNALREVAAGGAPLYSRAWVALLNHAPRSRRPQALRICRQSIVRGFCQSLLKQADAQSLAAHLTPAMRRYALQRAMHTNQLQLCRALVSMHADAASVTPA